MVFLGTPWQLMPRKPHLSAKRIFVRCGLASKVRSAELGIILLPVD